MEIDGEGTSGNVVAGNFIGTDAAGTRAVGTDEDDSPLGNGGSGVEINAGATSNTIGGLAAGAGNIISGNIFQGGDGGLGVGPHLTGSGPHSVRGLERVAALDALAALLALTDMDIELTVKRLPRNFGLILLGDGGFDQRAATAGTGVR